MGLSKITSSGLNAFAKFWKNYSLKNDFLKIAIIALET